MTITLTESRLWSASDVAPVAARWDAWEVEQVLPITADRNDPLEGRFGLLANLRPGWDGDGAVPPSRRAISTLYAAVRQLSNDRRSRLGASAHSDGYIAVTLELGQAARYADIYPDHIEYEAEDDADPWTGELDAAQLQKFLIA